VTPSRGWSILRGMASRSSDGPAVEGRPPEDGATGRSWRRWVPWLLLRASHPRLGLLSAVGVAGAAALSGRPTREVGMVLATVLVGQAILGWHNDLVDRRRDATDGREDKPIGQGMLAPGDATFAMACGALLVVPLAVSHGLWSGVSYLASLLIGLLGNVILRYGWLSWLSWAAAYSLYPAFLAYGGWAGEGPTTPPEIAVTALAALLGVCVHVLVSLPGLVRDNEHGVRHLPLRLGLRMGAARLLWSTIVLTAAVLAGLLATGSQVGLRQ
jgi:4-hydroxybenzoate polyprenyltransferase